MNFQKSLNRQPNRSNAAIDIFDANQHGRITNDIQFDDFGKGQPRASKRKSQSLRAKKKAVAIAVHRPSSRPAATSLG